MSKPIIGALPLVDSEKNCYWMLPGYMKGIELAGGIPVMLPLTSDKEIISQIVNDFDGFLFTGGHDVSPSVYGFEKSADCGECSDERDSMEKIIFELAFELNKSMFGICRGIQFFNAVMGGTLYQDLPSEYGSSVNHHQTPPYHIPVHTVDICPSSPLYLALKTDKLSVNSYHHQAIKDLSPELAAMAISEDGLIESVYSPNKRFVWAVQWHPEFSYEVDEASRKLFEMFVRSTVCP